MKTKSAKHPARPITTRPAPDNSAAPIIDLVPSFLRLKKILVPVDFSDFSAKAVKYAARFAEQFDAALVLVHFVEPVRYPESVLIPPEMEEANRERLKLARTALAEFVKKQVPAGLETETVTRFGHAVDGITLAAKDLDVDLIVIATHGHTGLKHLLLGSVAERVVRLAPCPVLTVREREHEFV